MIRKPYFNLSVFWISKLNILDLCKMFKNTIRRVAKIGLIPSVIAILFAPVLIKWFLGDEWIVVGTFMQIMMPWIFFQFVNISVSTTFSVVNRQEVGFLLIVISVLLRYSAMNYWHETAIIQITALSIVASLFYISYMVSAYIVLRKMKWEQLLVGSFFTLLI